MNVSGLTGDSFDRNESIGGDANNFPFESRDDLFDVATVLALCDADPGLFIGAIQSMADQYRAYLRETGESTRAVLRENLQPLQEDIDARTAIRDGMAAQRDRKKKLLEDLADRDERITRLRAEIERARRVEEARRIAEEQENLRKDHERALVDLRETATRVRDARTAQWKEAESQRQQHIKRLEAAAEHARVAVEQSTKRVEALGDSLVTYRVAKFLAWLGYASVAATGTVWTLLVKSSSVHDVSHLLPYIYSFTNSLASTPLRRYVYAAGVLIGTLGVISGLTLLVDWLLRRSFEWDEKEEPDHEKVRLSATSLSRRSYVQLLAAVPFLFCGGLALVFVTTGPKPGNDIGDLLPVLAHTFVGSAIALLSTAVFVLYAIKSIEPRLRDRGGAP